ncbi:MAG: methylenetetrahydrofolate reductase [NAD(P)H] [Myxococcales bacterium]|nr:methylenetetrahydrofolate reductase [NAD(P)H] [Myxococcales bacterium]
MRVIEHLERADEPLISFEIIPPRRGGDLTSLLGLIDDLVAHRPPFIDITSHPAVVSYEEGPDGIRKVIKRKRPGTLGVCALIQHKYNVDAVPHVLCRGFTREETEDFLIELHYLGIDNVLIIRGDDNGYDKPVKEGRSANCFAIDLVSQVGDMNQGQFLEPYLQALPTNFCVGVAGYPEKHMEAANLDMDIRRLREKVEAGADYIVTQMFFENSHYFKFVEKCRDHGITVPIIPGIKVLTVKKHLTNLPRIFNCEIPTALADEVEAAEKGQVLDIGVEWTANQAQELLDAGVPSVHFYVMQSSKPINKVLKRLKR